jgi:hypothetical protein
MIDFGGIILESLKENTYKEYKGWWAGWVDITTYER